MTVKLMMCGRRRPGLTRRDQQQHMKEIHGSLVLQYIANDPDNAPRGYVQNHAVDSTFAQGEGVHPAFALGFDFVTEVYFPDLGTAKASRETAFYLENLMPDEPQMVDTANVLGLPFTETPIQPSSVSGDAFKLFVVMAKDAVVATETIEAARQSLPPTQGYTRNVAAVPSPIGAIDVFRFTDIESATAFASAFQHAVLSNDGSQHAVLVIAKEYLLYPVPA